MFTAARICHTRKIKHFLPLSYHHGFHATKLFSTSSPPSPLETQINDPQSPPFELQTLLKDPQSHPFQLQTVSNYAQIKDPQSSIELQTAVSNYAQIQNFSREGNYDQIACQTKDICNGCGVHMQDIDRKQPGFYKMPSVKSPYYKVNINHDHFIEEYEASNLFKKGFLNELMLPDPPPLPQNKPIICERCHSLRNYGKVMDVAVETALPEFDFYRTVGRKLASASGVRSVVLMVVDAADFDGSFPKMIADLVSMTIDKCSMDWKEGKSGNVPRLVLVLSKIDLLPNAISPTGLEHWVRARARECGVLKLTSLHLVSAVRGWGVGHLIDDVVQLVGDRGNVWAVGAQNAGKSTLINAMQKFVTETETGEWARAKTRTKQEKKMRKRMGTGAGVGGLPCLTEAGVPGTTLGIVRVEGILPGKAKLFDTPGLFNPHNLVNRLTMDEQRLVQITKELRPRTYRLKAGRSVHIAGLMRLDIEKLSVETVYITVWASPLLPLHMSRTENVDKLKNEFFGKQLQPPIGEDRVKEIGNWARREFHVTGSSWEANAVDVAAAGVGWFSIGLNGEAVIGVWTYDGVEVTVRKALLPHKASEFEIAGFSASKIAREADRARNGGRKKKASRGISNAITSINNRWKHELN
ncbi:GTP-binding protein BRASSINAZOLE INSENSITIVE PALE GREEN 2, chloroplastic [Silene latifolia]|uniref:GTP-binding protein BRASSINAZOLE INSENSITIVE PALE GREEN 2, chloroplastic n=1 Tax=Silene latifolia TaxID=37657 RepID=UPI003D771AAD